MQKREFYIKKRETVRKWSENVYLTALAMYIIHEFLRYTMFPIDWNAPFGGITFLNDVFIWFYETPQYFLAGILVVRILCFKTYDWKYFLASAVIWLCAHNAWTNNNIVDILFWALLVMGAKEIPFKKIIKMHLVLLVVLLSVTNLAAILGLIENVQYNRSDGRIRHAFGMTYPTNLAAYIFYAVLCYWYYKGEKLNYIDVAITGGLGIMVLTVNVARCSFICLMMTMVFMILYKKKVQISGSSWLLSMSVPVCAILMMAMTIFYSSENSSLYKLNVFLNSRLSLGKKGVDIYGFRMWGQAISMNGNGEGAVAAKYFFLDCSYMKISIMYGIVIFGLVLLGFYVIGCQARMNGEWVLLWILALIAIHNVEEHHLLEISNCTFILAVFAERRPLICHTGIKRKKGS